MPARRAEAEWQGDLREGKGRVKLGSGAFEAPYSFRSRFEDGPGTNPEELLGAAHAGCFSMALAAALSAAGHPPTRVFTTATVHIERADAGFAVSKIELATEVSAPGIAADVFQNQAQEAKKNCPISKALAATEIVLSARLVS
jgi:osmotically inducible protein OsmC